jgi:asparagine synthase (glutamine-hydrolysing)
MLPEAHRPVGFSFTHRSGGAEIQVFRPQTDVHPSLVGFIDTPAATCALLGRLYYRQELVADLDPSPSDGIDPSAAPNDAALALAVYRQFGAKGLERLEGDFSLVLWDAREGRVIAVRDPMGGYPLFWTEVGETFALSTSMRPLLRLLPRHSLDLDYLADYLLVNGSQSELPSERCVYQGIHRLLPGSMLSVSFPARKTERRVYWRWLDRLVDPGTDRLEDISAQYRDAVTQAVRERLRGRTVSHLSGWHGLHRRRSARTQVD